jgi:thiamine-monophosphate kinase
MPRPDEFSLIADYFAPLAADAPGAYGLGDDAASFAPSPGKELVLTVDAIVEGVHFLPDDPAEDVARKLLRVSLSDLAAKGARPRGYLLTTHWTTRTPVEWIAAFARGLAADQDLFGLSLWGGDTVSTPGPLTFSLTAIGEVDQGTMLRRSGGQVGDDLYVTGTIGDGALGLLAALGKLDVDAGGRAALVGRYRRPEPRVGLGPALVGLAGASLDVSDGLMADLGHLCARSGVGARIDVASLPLSAAAEACLALSPALIETVLTGGDDYEILFSASPSRRGEVDSVAARCAVQVTRIGKLVSAGEGIEARDAKGAVLAFKQAGFRHF